MTDDEPAEQIFKSTRNALKRFLASQPHASADDLHREIVAQYLTGASQLAHFLIRMDGEVTAQQAERALAIVGTRLGMHFETP